MAPAPSAAPSDPYSWNGSNERESASPVQQQQQQPQQQVGYPPQSQVQQQLAQQAQQAVQQQQGQQGQQQGGRPAYPGAYVPYQGQRAGGQWVAREGAVGGA
jgi:hypothetical protein